MEINAQAIIRKPRLWSLLFIRVGVITCLMGICTQMFMSAFPQYLQMKEFTATQMGLVATGYTVCAMVMRIFAGNLIDLKGRRLMCLVGLAFFGLPIVGFYFTESIGVTVALRFIQGFGASLATIATGTMAPDVLPKERMTEGIGYYGLFNSLATAIGPAVGIGFLLDGRSDIFFIFGFLMIVAATVVTVTVRYESKGSLQNVSSNAIPLTVEEIEAEERANAQAAEEEQRFFIWKFFDKKAIPAFIIAMSATFSMTTITNFISPYAISIGITTVGSFFTVQAVFMILSRICSGKIAGRIGVFRTIVLGFLLDAVALMLLATMKNDAFMFAAAAVRGLGGGLYFPLLNVLAVQNATKSRRGKATSTYYAAYDIGAGLGASFWGVIADNFGGFRTVYMGAALFYSVSITVAYLLVGKKEKTLKRESTH
ncbi:MAG: MFS transporter [Clostridiaceae bacterium]|nr:MFS transporter [Clostridiaceae bacterium]